MKRIRAVLMAALSCAATSADARRCELNGEDVNPDNGATTAGKTGVMRCFRDDGSLWYEQALHAGERLGLDRRHDEDGAVRERMVNSQGNTDGRARSWWPGGQPHEDGEYRNGQAIGTHQAWHSNGQLKALRVHPDAGGPAALMMAWSETGHLRELRCAERSLAALDVEPCGHQSMTTTTLHDARGRVREQRRMLRGALLGSEHFGDDGKRTASIEATPRGRIETRFHPDGSAAQRDKVEDGFRVLRESWYMNGARKERLVVEPKDRDARSVSEFFRDDGTLLERLVEIGQRVLTREHFDARGLLAEDWTYAPEGHVTRHRALAPDGRVLRDETLYPDGSRKVVASEPKGDR